MRTLIGQSESVLQEIRNIVDGDISSLNLRFEQHDLAFAQIHSKHQTYDDIVSRRPQQGKGTFTGVWQEPQYGLIHDKDIKMPLFPEKPENNETFRRWWKDFAEYCERSRRVLGCTYVFKTIRGYQDRIDGPDYLKFFTEVNKSLPGDRSNLDWEGGIADKELLCALKHVMQGKCSYIVSQLSTHEGGFELLRLL